MEKKIFEYCNRSEFLDAMRLHEIERVEFLAQGEYNINYKVTATSSVENGRDQTKSKMFVFRLNTASQLQLEDQIVYEYDALVGLEKSGVTPSPLYLDDSRDYFPQGILCMEFLKGDPLDYKKDLHKAARLFATIHDMDTAPFKGRMIEEKGLCKARVEEGKRWLSSFEALVNDGTSVVSSKMEESLSLLNRLIRYCEVNCESDDAYFERDPWMVVNNTEVNSHNFIIGDEAQYIIDWEKPVLSEPVQDITQFLAPTTTLWRTEHILSIEETDSFYQAYGECGKRDIEELKRRVDIYRPYLYLRALSWCAHAWVDYQGERTIRNEHTWNRITMYLEPSFMKEILVRYL